MNILDLVTASVGYRKKILSHRYPDGAELEIARAAGVRFHNSDKSQETLIKILSEEINKVEHPYFNKPSWNCSVG